MRSPSRFPPGSPVVERVASAFAFGVNSSRSRATPAALREFGSVMDESISRAIPAAEWSFIRGCLAGAERSLQSARQSRLEEASRQSDAMWAEVDSRIQSLSLVGRMLTDVFLGPGFAYLHYRLEDYDGARAIIRRVSDLDHRLATEFGLVHLGVHRLQLAGNLLRIHTRLDERSEALQLGAMLLDYLELRAEPPSNDILSARALLDSSPGAILEYYFDKITGDLGVFLAGNGDSGCFRHHGFAGSDECLHGFAPRAHGWMRMKRAALQGEVESSLDMSADLLRTGCASSPSLWFATVMEVATQFRYLGGDASVMADRMLAEASALAEAPWELQQAIHRR